MRQHPNASAAGISGAVVTIGVWAATSLGVEVPPEVAAAVTTVVAALVLAVGRRRA